MFKTTNQPDLSINTDILMPTEDEQTEPVRLLNDNLLAKETVQSLPKQIGFIKKVILPAFSVVSRALIISEKKTQ